MKNILFMGTPAFSVGVLQSLLDAGYQVKTVVTQPDRLVGRKKTLQMPPVKELALANSIPVLQPEKISGSQELEELMKTDYDLLITAAYGQFIPEKLLQHPKFGAINVHASLLPKYRGGAPIQYAIMNGDAETGVTIMRMVKKMDAGNILSQSRIPIKASDDAASMFDKLSGLGSQLLIETLPALFAGTIEEIEQEESQVTFSPNITTEQEAIDWSEPAQVVVNHVRALHPSPGSHTYLDGQRWKIWQGHTSELSTTESPGTVIEFTKDKITVAAGDGTSYAVTKIQPAGKKAMRVRDFYNGAQKSLEVGMVFTNAKES